MAVAGGGASTPFLAGELFKAMTGVEWVWVQYRGNSICTTTDLMWYAKGRRLREAAWHSKPENLENAAPQADEAEAQQRANSHAPNPEEIY